MAPNSFNTKLDEVEAILDVVRNVALYFLFLYKLLN